MIDLGNLGGTGGNLPAAINNHGHVVGQSDLPGDTTHHAFLWTEEDGMQDLGTLNGQPVSYAFGINNKEQVVGIFEDFVGDNTTGFLWQDGVMTDLNTLIPSGSPLFVKEPIGIDDREEIVGFGLASKGNERAFLLTPCDEEDGDGEGCEEDAAGTAATARVSSAPTTQHPASLTPGGRMLSGMLNRSRFAWGQRNSDSGNGPAPEQKQEHPADAVTNDSKADQMLDPESCFPWRCRQGYCWASQDAHGEWVLNGYCIATIPGTRFCSAKGSSCCPSGAKPKDPAQLLCGAGFNVVDFARKCSF